MSNHQITNRQKVLNAVVALVQVVTVLGAATIATVQPSALESVTGAPSKAAANGLSKPSAAAHKTPLVLTPTDAPQAANQVFGTLPIGPISGMVYDDKSNDGIFQPSGSLTETGVAGITVRAYDDNNALVGTATTNASGMYTINPSALGPWRLEFSNIPDGYLLARRINGTLNDTSTQFITTTGSTGNDFGIYNPIFYPDLTPNPYLFTVASPNGDPLVNPTTTGNSGMVNNAWVFRANAQSEGIVIPAISKGKDTGALWGVAIQRTTQKLFMAAAVKRHAGMGRPASAASMSSTIRNLRRPQRRQPMSISPARLTTSTLAASPALAPAQVHCPTTLAAALGHQPYRRTTTRSPSRAWARSALAILTWHRMSALCGWSTSASAR